MFIGPGFQGRKSQFRFEGVGFRSFRAYCCRGAGHNCPQLHTQLRNLVFVLKVDEVSVFPLLKLANGGCAEKQFFISLRDCSYEELARELAPNVLRKSLRILPVPSYWFWALLV